MALSIQPAAEEQYSALDGILALCADHMHRVQGNSQWYPFPASPWFDGHAANKNRYAVLRDDLLVATFSLGPEPPPYYQGMAKYWDTGAKSLYLSGLAVLPAQQQRGTGKWIMQQIGSLAAEQEMNRVRFDTLSHNQKLAAFFDSAGYERRGMLLVERFLVILFEQVF